MKNYLYLAISILSLISCSKATNLTESFGLLSLLGYRQNVTINGSFFGNFNADVKAYPLGANGKCERTGAGLGLSSTDNTGSFSINYPRINQSGGYVCIISSPKADGTSRFFAVDQQKEFPWTGSTAFNVLVLPEPSTTTRSKFNVVSTMFNRMATQRLERLAAGNTDLTRTGDLLKTANKQIVGQFGLSRGITRGVIRASSVEAATPDLNDIAIDFNNKEDPTALKFTVMIGGIQSLGDPTKPESYDQVVNVISKYLASGTGSSVDENGEPLILPGQTQPLSLGGNSLATQISQKVATFVQAQASALGLPPSAVAAVTQQVQQQVSAVDKPSFGITAAPVVVQIEPKMKYSELNKTIFKADESFIVTPDYTSTNAERYSLTTDVVLPPTIKISINSFSGVINGKVEKSFSGNLDAKLTVTGTAPGGRTTTQVFSLTFQGSFFQYSAPEYTFYLNKELEIQPSSAFIESYKLSVDCGQPICELNFYVDGAGVIKSEIPPTFRGKSTYNLVVTATSFTGDVYNRQVKVNVVGSPAVVYQGAKFEGTNIRSTISLPESDGSTITIKPEINSHGVVEASFSMVDGVLSSLPEGLILSKNGEISGTINLTNVYNTFIDFKDITTGLTTVYNLELQPLGPLQFTYPDRFLNLSAGESSKVEILPVYSPLSTEKGGAKICSLSPSCGGLGYGSQLPSGLSLDSKTCSISGIPTIETPEALYCIEAVNYTTAGLQRATATLRIGVLNPEVPQFNLVSGQTYYPPTTLAVSSNIPDGKIYFTTDGSNPTTGSILYSGAQHIWSLAGKKIKAYLSSAYGDSPTTEFGIIAVPPLQTGVEKSSDTLGDDAYFNNGLPRTANVNVDTTITYQSTGLTWQAGDLGPVNWDASKTICSKNFGTAWRLPTIEELTTIVNVNDINSWFSFITDNRINTRNAPYWSDTLSKEASGYAFAIGFGFGRIFTDNINNANYVRCVKSDVPYRKTNSFLASSINPSVVYDEGTGLLWESNNDSKTLKWSDAINYCNALSLDGKKWRLPNRNELLSLVDYSASSFPLIDSSHFQNTLPRYWSSTRDKSSNPYPVAFSIYRDGISEFDDGKPISGSNLLGVRCVSGPYSNSEVIYPEMNFTFSSDPITGGMQPISIKPAISSARSFTFTAVNLPSGYTLNPTTGEISGTQDNGNKFFQIIATSTEPVPTQRVSYSFPFDIRLIGLQDIGYLNYTVYRNPSITKYAWNADDFDTYFQNTESKVSNTQENTAIVIDSGYRSAQSLLHFTSTPNKNGSFPNSDDYYSVKVEGYFRPTRSGDYTFSCTGDDAVDLFINNELVCSHYGDHGFATIGTYTGKYTVLLENVNKPVAFRARMQEIGGGDGLEVKWKRPGDSNWNSYPEEMSRY